MEFVPDSQQPIIESEIFLPILRVHRPSHPGCEGKTEFEQVAGKAVDGTLSVFGMGGGKGEALTTRFTGEYPADRSCSEWVMPAMLSFQFLSTRVDGTEVGYGARGSVERTGLKLVERPIPKSDDGCQIPSEQVPTTRWVNPQGQLDRRRTKSKAPVWEWCEVERETKGKLSVGLSLGSRVPAKVSLDFLRTVSTRQKTGAGLAPGTTYLAYYPADENRFEICWSTV